MGTNTINDRSPGQTVQAADNNQHNDALQGDLVPRNTSGVATADAGSLGTQTFPFKRAEITSGHWAAGDVKVHHSYNGLVSAGQGWMKCDGRVINSTNYDAEHGAGSWNTYVGSSPLDGKFLPSLIGRYPVGVNLTNQDGTSAITPLGNSGNSINIQHSHTVNSHSHTTGTHQHQVMEFTGGISSAHQTFDLGGTGQNITTATSGGAVVPQIRARQTPSQSIWTGQAGNDPTRTYTSLASAGTTGNTSPGTDNQLSTGQSIQPDSIGFQYFMRII